MRGPWRNWSGSIAFEPHRIEHPGEESDVVELVRRAAETGRKVRAVGAGHSSSDILVADNVLVRTDRLSGVVSCDRDACEAVVRPGTVLRALGQRLYEADLALPNYGDVATQTIGGAIGTGTHGSGASLQNLSQMLLSARLVTGNGEVCVIGRDQFELLRAARVSLGSLGIFTELTLKLVPAFDVERREFAIGTEAGLAQLETLVACNLSFDFYWYPRRDDIKLRLVNPTGGGSLPRVARELERSSGYGHEVIPTHSGIPNRFEESEYALPAENGVACFRALRERIIGRWRHVVGWRVLYRTVASDDADLSPAFGRDTVTISLHQNSSLPWRAYFEDLEPVFLEHGGRPHWAKKHTRCAADLAQMYPRWAEFQRVRASLDPAGVFATTQMRELLGELPA